MSVFEVGLMSILSSLGLHFIEVTTTIVALCVQIAQVELFIMRTNSNSPNRVSKTYNVKPREQFCGEKNTHPSLSN